MAATIEPFAFLDTTVVEAEKYTTIVAWAVFSLQIFLRMAGGRSAILILPDLKKVFELAIVTIILPSLAAKAVNGGILYPRWRTI